MANTGQSKILKHLIGNSGQKLSIRKLSQMAEMDYKSAYNAVGSLKSQGIINARKIGNTTLCSFNYRLNSLVFEAERDRMRDILKNKNLMVIRNHLIELNFPLVVLLFGSYAKKTNTQHSDIDLLVISENPSEIDQELSLIPLKIHLTQVTYKEFMMSLKSREFNVVEEAIRHNIILVGIEEYYRLLENAEQGTYKRGGE